MKLTRLLSVLSTLLSAATADTDPGLPADVQVNLLFPRNETYAPVVWFPIIFGLQNLDAVWPLDVYLEGRITRLSSSNGTYFSSSRDVDIFTIYTHDYGLRDNVLYDGSTINQTVFHIPLTTSLWNTNDRFSVSWRFGFSRFCFANETAHEAHEGSRLWDNSRDRHSREVLFNTAPDGQLPDVEKALNSCAEPDPEADIAVRITELRYSSEAEFEGVWGSTQGQKNCPVLDTSLQADRCAYKPYAQEVAANVSDMVLRKFGCEEGPWQTGSWVCGEDGSVARFGVDWVLAMVLAAAFCLLQF